MVEYLVANQKTRVRFPYPAFFEDDKEKFMELKLMQYNILGGFHTGEEPYIYQPERQKLALEVIKAEDPDVLTICEARFAHPNKFKILQDYKKIFGYPYSYVASYKERSGMGIFSKFPFEVEDYARGLTPLLRARFKIKGKDFMLDLFHPHPTLKEEEVEKFLKHILVGIDKCPYILMGDLNSISPDDKYDPKTMLKGFSKFEEDPKRIVDEFLKKKVIRQLLDKNLRDTFNVVGRPWHCTIPTDMLSVNKDSGTRIDYIFCSEEFKIKDAEIIVNELTNKASDHYPISAVLEV